MSDQPRHLTRRSFLAGAAGGILLPTFVPSAVIGANAPSNRITMALIGLGSMGMRHVKGFLQESDCRIVAVCDVDSKRRDEAAGAINKHYRNTACDRVHDFRKLLVRGDVDTLCIAVPDHWHSIPAIGACRAGKDIYGEKPLALTIAEGRAMVRAVRRYGVVWQMGSWQRSTSHFRFACELVRNGRIGKLEGVEVAISRGSAIAPQPVMPVPKHFDYNMWLGPAPRAEYTEKRCHWNFRWILDYSGGQVTDWGAHHIDIAHWGMGADGTGPVEVAGTGKFPVNGLWNAAVEYDFTCTYADPLPPLRVRSTAAGACVRFTGERGSVTVNRGGLKTEPAGLAREKIGVGEIHLVRPTGDHRQGHRRDFLDCVKSRNEPITPVEIGHRSATVAHLGNIAMILGRKIRWDPKTEQILDDPTASRMLSRTMRGHWKL